MNLSKNDYEKIMHFINSTNSEPSNMSKTVQIYLSDLFHFHHSLFWLADKQSNMYNLNFFNFDDKFIWDYTETYMNKDLMHPKKQIKNVTNKQSILKVNETTTPSSFIKSEYYHFLKRHQIIDVMVVYLTDNRYIYGGIGFTRHKGDKPFTQKERHTLQTLSTHLQHLVKTSMIIEEIEAENIFLKRKANENPGIILVNGNQNISFYNEAAQKIIATICPNTSVEEFFHTSINNYLSEEESTININMNEWKVKVIPHKMKQNPTSKKYSIYLYPEENKKSNDLKALLSKRELEIFDFVLKGYTNEQISNELWISINTVKKHLRNMYEKLDVSNRTSLIYKLKEVDHFI